MRENLIKNLIKIASQHITESYKGRRPLHLGLFFCFIREVSAEFWCNQQATTDLEFSYYYILPAPYNPHLSGYGCFIFMAQNNPQHINKTFL